MAKELAKSARRKKVAWGITGAGEMLTETLEVMKQMKLQYQHVVDIQVYLSKTGSQVVKYYKINDDLRMSFDRVLVEVDSNSPFLAGWMQVGKFEFLLVAPASSNTVAKIAGGICDTMLCNAVIMGLKAFASVYVMPTDYREGTVYTKLPNGTRMKLRIRQEDAKNAQKLSNMENLAVLERPSDICKVFAKHFST